MHTCIVKTHMFTYVPLELCPILECRWGLMGGALVQNMVICNDMYISFIKISVRQINDYIFMKSNIWLIPCAKYIYGIHLNFSSIFVLQKLLIASRNLEFFTNGYRYLIQILPAAVVAPMYFSGKIEFGVINQSVSAFNHILSDFSLIVYQFQAISAFSAVIERLGEIL